MEEDDDTPVHASAKIPLLVRTDCRKLKPSVRDAGFQAVPGWVTFKSRVQELLRLAADDSLASGNWKFDLEERLKCASEHGYKDRMVHGRLLHYAVNTDALDPAEREQSSASRTKVVLEAGAKVNSTCGSGEVAKELELQAIHMAAGLGCLPGIRLLLHHQADINAMSTRNGLSYYSPIHDAVFCKQCDALKLLVSSQADPMQPNADGMFCIHLAAWVGSTEIVHYLLKTAQGDVEMLRRRAKIRTGVRSTTTHALTALALASSAQQYPVEDLLTLAPFRYGQGSFFSEIREIVHINPTVAAAIMDSIDKLPDQDRSRITTWIVQEALRRHGRYSNSLHLFGTSLVQCVSDIIYHAPQAAAKILNALTVDPIVADAVAIRHPLPRTVSLSSNDPLSQLFGIREDMHCAYVADYAEPDHCYKTYSDYLSNSSLPNLGLPEWRMDNEKDEQDYPDWHEKFAPVPKRDQVQALNREVEVRVLCLPNVLDLRVVHSMKHVPILGFFAQRAVLGCAQELWKLVFPVFYMDTFVEMLVTVLLTDRAVRLQEGDHRGLGEHPGELYNRLSLSILIAEAARNTFRLGYYMAMYKFCYNFNNGLLSDRVFGIPKLFFEMLRILLLQSSIFLSMCFAAHSSHQFSGAEVFLDTVEDGAFDLGSLCHVVLCLNCFTRWINNTNMLCVISGVGPKVISLFSSLAPMGAILSVGFFFFMAFLTPLLSMRGKVSALRVAHDLFSSMVRSDTNTLPMLEGLDQDSGLATAVCQATMFLVAVIFTMCYMNILIGMFCSVFSSIESRSDLLFVRTRISVCERYLLEPVWPSESTRQLPFILAFCLLVIWLLLVLFWESYFVVPGVLLATSLILAQAGLVQNDVMDADIKQNGYHMFQDGEDADDSLLLEDPDENCNGESDHRASSRQATVASSSSSWSEVDDDDKPTERCLWMCHSKSPVPGEDFREDRFATIQSQLHDLSCELLELRKGQLDLAASSESCKEDAEVSAEKSS